MELNQEKKNVLLLSLCQALVNTGNSLIVTVSALTGFALATDKSLATLPLALQFTATTFSSILASMLMKRWGRRVGFIIGALIGMAGGGLSAYGIFQGSFALFCAGAFVLGIYNGFGLYYRFAAADTASDAFRSKAISYVMAGGVLAAIVGPELAKWSRNLFTPHQFAGTYLTMVALPVISIFFLAFIVIAPPSEEERTGQGRPLDEIVQQPTTLVAILGGMVGYGVMVLLMTATPIAMKTCSFDFDDTAFVIQWHILGMFAPSFFTGSLIKKIGVLQVIMLGAVFNLVAVGFNLSGTSLFFFWTGQLLLGLGWNFLFIGSTTLLTETYTPSEKAKTQAMNEFLVFTITAIASVSSGALQYHFGWKAVNFGVIPMLVLILSAGFWLYIQRQKLETASKSIDD